ncbi:hypothetical protein LSH36_198g05021 [Paralvinella palmiformis]|uniref:Uncharacterized protein n=1 Tax=Paralvinella palmiformis TaxID=53620 RepID=A0AAD9N7N1_9ANNE|nr:hypothetical protein LSH36_198g05021 [Paralvinella palmiformis]
MYIKACCVEALGEHTDEEGGATTATTMTTTPTTTTTNNNNNNNNGAPERHTAGAKIASTWAHCGGKDRGTRTTVSGWCSKQRAELILFRERVVRAWGTPSVRARDDVDEPTFSDHRHNEHGSYDIRRRRTWPDLPLPPPAAVVATECRFL